MCVKNVYHHFYDAVTVPRERNADNPAHFVDWLSDFHFWPSLLFGDWLQSKIEDLYKNLLKSSSYKQKKFCDVSMLAEWLRNLSPPVAHRDK
jgi:hypothetical protein